MVLLDPAVCSPVQFVTDEQTFTLHHDITPFNGLKKWQIGSNVRPSKYILLTPRVALKHINVFTPISLFVYLFSLFFFTFVFVGFG